MSLGKFDRANPSVRAILEADTPRLASALSLSWAEARLELRVLLEQVLRVDRVWLVLNQEDALHATDLARYEQLLRRRLAGEPVAYILGRREFYGRSFMVNPDVLIPRPETEQLIDLAVARLPDSTPEDVLDLGTGSGCIAITLAILRPACRVVGIDVSQAALAVARENASALGAQVSWVLGHWYDALAGRKFGLILSNPPYIAQGDIHLASGDARFEPRAALASGCAGLDDLTVIIGQSHGYLKSGGWLLLEHGWDQGAAVTNLMRSQGFQSLETCKDLAGLDRITMGKCR
ncbi:MAG: peptide chain release factor N(5)-glutamine methyltransferase [Thiobacillaceae bacterium]